MSETDTSQRPETNELAFKNDPAAVIAEHLSRVGEPNSASVEAAAELIRTSYPRRDALGVSLDLNTRIDDPTTVLAAMFANGHDALPPSWNANPEIVRTVLSISGQIEAGILRARQLSVAHEGGNPHTDARLDEVEHFIELLQQK